MIKMKLGSKYNSLNTPAYWNVNRFTEIKKISASNFFMHIFIMAVTYLQSVEDHWKL